jgi:hypothetical protein
MSTPPYKPSTLYKTCLDPTQEHSLITTLIPNPNLEVPHTSSYRAW